MPTLPPVPEVIRFKLDVVTEAPVICSNRLFMQYTGGPPTIGDLTTLATDIATQWASKLAPLVSNQYTLFEVDAVDLTSGGAAATTTVSHAGTASSTPGPIQVPFHLQYHIVRRYRGGKPGGYWPFGGEGAYNDDKSWTPSFLASCLTDFEAFMGAVVGLSSGSTDLVNHVNVSYYEGFTSVEDPITHRWRNIPTPRSTPIIDIVAGYTAGHRFSSQRRRRGPNF